MKGEVLEMGSNEKCIIKGCDYKEQVGEREKLSFHELPSQRNQRLAWHEVLQDKIDNDKLYDRSKICSQHFAQDCFAQTIGNKRRRLTRNAIPTIFKSAGETHMQSQTNNNEPYNIPSSTSSSACSTESHSIDYIHKGVQVEMLRTQETILSEKEKTISDLKYNLRIVNTKLRRLRTKQNETEQKLQNLKSKYQLKEFENVQTIIEDGNNSEPAAVFLLDQINNYKRKKPKWSEITIRQCIVWRYSSPKGYEHPRNSVLKLPSRTTLHKYLGLETIDNLLINRLKCEANHLEQPSERMCSLVIDDMSIKERVTYSKTEDRIFGTSTAKGDALGEKPTVANSLLCFVIRGLSTKYVIPAGYHFHRSLKTKDLYNLAMKVLRLLYDCGFFVLRIVTDNHKSFVALFKMFGNGKLVASIPHPFQSELLLFFSFDYCHAVKNARNLFLDHDMCSALGVISSRYLKCLMELQKDWIVKPVRFLTKKHLYPTNIEKMNVLRAVQLFSLPVTASLRYISEHGGDELIEFRDCDASVLYMENMYKFFQIHDVSNRTKYIHSNDMTVAPYVDVEDERLEWLHGDFQSFIDDIQRTSISKNMRGLSAETAEALKFTAESTYQCVRYLIRDQKFYYVLTRNFNSDAVEAMFSHVRLRGGSNDLTDARAAEHAIKQILRCGIIKHSLHSNVVSSENNFTSTALLDTNSATPSTNPESCDISMPQNLPDDVLGLLNKLSTSDRDDNLYDIQGASIAFMAGYLIRRVDDSTHCQVCVKPLEDNTDDEKNNVLLGLIYKQDRGKLKYPSTQFVGLIHQLVEVIVRLLPYVSPFNTSQILNTILFNYLRSHDFFACGQHGEYTAKMIIDKFVGALLANHCKDLTLNIRPPTKKSAKPLRKELKLNN